MDFFQQYFWPKINIFNPRKSYFVNTMNDSSSKIGHEFRKYSVSEIEVIKFFFLTKDMLILAFEDPPLKNEGILWLN